jgi:hypothetical protein
VERRDAPVGEAREIQRLRREIEEGRTETESAIVLAAAAGIRVLGVLAVQQVFGHQSVHLASPGGAVRFQMSPVSQRRAPADIGNPLKRMRNFSDLPSRTLPCRP